MNRLLVLIVVVAITGGLLTASRFRQPPPKISGFIEANEIRIGSRVGGRVAEVLVGEGEMVQAGQVLLKLEPHDLLERLAEAQAQLQARSAVRNKLKAGPREEEKAQAQAKVDGLTAAFEKLVAGPRTEEIAAARSRVVLSEAQLERARRSNDRLQALFNRDPNSVSREDLDRAIEDFKVAEATLQVRSEELQLLEHGSRLEDKAQAKAELELAQQALAMAVKGYRPEEIEEAEAAVISAHASVAAVQRQLAELEIKAPVDGVIDALELRPGDLVAPNGPVLTIVENSRLWVRAYLPENRLNLKLGDKLRVTVDSFPNQDFKGRVSFISSQAEFTPRNVQTVEERSKQVFRIKVEVEEDRQLLRAGMAADVWL